MKPGEEKVVLAAPGKTDTVICDRCFASVKATEEFCPECGATLAQEAGREGSDREIYPELARANLLRMRGEYKQAQDVCRAILRRYPNNMTANSLLGDISVEAGELDQAVQWYELALDIQPDNTAVRKKLETVKSRLDKADTNTVAAQLGLPTEKPKTGLIAGGLIAAIVVVGAVAYMIGQNVQAKKTEQPQVTRIEAPKIDNAPPATQGDEPSNNAGNVDSSGGNVPAGAFAATSNEDRSAMQMITQRAEDGARVTSVVQDPRSGLMVLTFGLQQGDDARQIGARLAKATFDNVSTVSTITLRGLRDGAVAFVADSRRDLYQQTQAPAWQEQNQSDPNAWMNHILTSVWPSDTPTTGGGPSTPPSDSGTQPPTTGGETQGSTGQGGQ